MAVKWGGVGAYYYYYYYFISFISYKAITTFDTKGVDSLVYDSSVCVLAFFSSLSLNFLPFHIAAFLRFALLILSLVFPSLSLLRWCTISMYRCLS